MDQLSTPVVVEHDGWTLASGSENRPSEQELKVQLGAEPEGSTEPTEAETEARETREARETTAAEAEPPVELPPAEPAEEPGADARQPKRRTHDPQKRIDKYHAELAIERERIARLEAELRTYREPPPAPPPPAAAPAPAASAPAPVWGGAEGYEAQGKSWEDYEKDMRAWTREDLRAETARMVDERIAEQREQAATTQRSTVAQAQQAAHDAAFLQRVNTVRARRPDYDTVVANLGGLNSDPLKHLIYYSAQGPEIGLHLGEHLDQAKALVALPFTPPIVDAIRRSEAPVAMLQHFAQHPEEFHTLTRMDPVSTLVAIGRLEARLTVGPTVTTAAAPPVTRARPPLRTVSGGAPVPRTSGAPLDDLEFGPEYVLRANREDNKRGLGRRGF